MTDGIGVYNLVKGINSTYELIRTRTTGYSADYKINTTFEAINLIKSVFGIDIMIEVGVFMICLDETGTVIGLFEVFKGTSNKCLINLKGIMIRALLCNAKQIIIVRNQINNGIKTTSVDNECYEKIKEACRLFGMRLVDSIIVDDSSYYSFTEQSGKTYQETRNSNNGVKGNS